MRREGTLLQPTEVFQDLRTCDVTGFCDVADQKHRDAAGFGELQQLHRARLHLRHTAGAGWDAFHVPAQSVRQALSCALERVDRCTLTWSARSR